MSFSVCKNKVLSLDSRQQTTAGAAALLVMIIMIHHNAQSSQCVPGFRSYTQFLCEIPPAILHHHENPLSVVPTPLP